MLTIAALKLSASKSKLAIHLRAPEKKIDLEHLEIKPISVHELKCTKNEFVTCKLIYFIICLLDKVNICYLIIFHICDIAQIFSSCFLDEGK